MLHCQDGRRFNTSLWRKQNMFPWLWFQFCKLNKERCHHEYSLHMRRKMWWEPNVMNGFIGESNIKSYLSKGLCRIKLSKCDNLRRWKCWSSIWIFPMYFIIIYRNFYTLFQLFIRKQSQESPKLISTLILLPCYSKLNIRM